MMEFVKYLYQFIKDNSAGWKHIARVCETRGEVSSQYTFRADICSTHKSDITWVQEKTL